MWKRRGTPWSSQGVKAPRGWNAQSQLASLRASGQKIATKKKL